MTIGGPLVPPNPDEVTFVLELPEPSVEGTPGYIPRMVFRKQLELPDLRDPTVGFVMTL